jgi:signal transduction histidine kinase
MSATASWARRHVLELGWAVFAVANLAVMALLVGEDGGTIPFHFIWVSLTILYGFTVWRLVTTTAVLAAVMVSTSAMILFEVTRGPTRPDELAEVPLMAAMFVAMVWHARRRASAQQAEIRSREREREFIRDSSHHLKTPLQLARGHGELLRSESLTSSQQLDVAALVRELDRMATMVDRMLMATTPVEVLMMNPRPIDLTAFVHNIVGRWMDAVDRSWTVQVTTDGELLADAERLEAALDALIENAVEATRVGGSVDVLVAGVDGKAMIRVSDDGEGIRAEDLPHVLDRYWTKPGRRERRGSGLGLAIVRATVEAHAGRLDVSSDESGSRFTMWIGPLLPARASHTEHEANARTLQETPAV